VAQGPGGADEALAALLERPNAILQGGLGLRTWIREGLGWQPPWWSELATWPDDRHEQWAERVCIIETDGQLSREETEMQTFRLIAKL